MTAACLLMSSRYITGLTGVTTVVRHSCTCLSGFYLGYLAGGGEDVEKDGGRWLQPSLVPRHPRLSGEECLVA